MPGVKGRSGRRRDEGRIAAICAAWVDLVPVYDICRRFGISASRLNQIIAGERARGAVLTRRPCALNTGGRRRSHVGDGASAS